MIQRKHSDFFEKLTQDIAKFFALLIGKNIDEIEDELELAYNEWLKLDRKSLDEMEPEELLAILLNELNLDADHIEVLALLSAEEGAFYFSKNQFFKSKDKLKKALILYDFVDREKQIFSFKRKATLEKISDLISKIGSN